MAHVRRRGDGWQILVHVGSGRYRSRTLRGVGRREAERAARRWETEIDRPSGTSVATLLDRWLATKADRSPTTLAEYARIIERVLKPALGSLDVADVDPETVDAYYAGLADRGLSPASVRRVHAVLRQAMALAVRWRWLRMSPCAGAALPAGGRPAIAPPDIGAVGGLLSRLESTDPWLALVVRIAATTGLRRGEMAGLHWSDVDFDARTMAVSRAVIMLAGGQLAEKAPKGGRARVVPVGWRLTAALRARQALHVAQCEACDVLWDPGRAWVLSDAPGGLAPVAPWLLTGRWRRAATAAGVSARLHDLRHLVATQGVAAGAPVTTVQGLLGHSTAVTTLGTYAHPASTGREVVEMMDRLIG